MSPSLTEPVWVTLFYAPSRLDYVVFAPRYSFYDGPPFATGLPHYGHILAGTIKDIVTRYAYQNGFHVERRFGWDCHGLPVVSSGFNFLNPYFFNLLAVHFC